MLVPAGGTYNLIQTDATLNPATAVTVKTGVTAPFGLLTTNSNGMRLMEAGGTLWKYDPALAPSVTNPAPVGFTFAAAPSGFLSDGTTAFFRVGGSFYRVPMDGSAAPTLMYTEPAGTTIVLMMLTSNRIVYDWSNATNNGVSSLPKTAAGATPPTVLKSGANVGATYFLHSTSGTGVNFSDVFRSLAYHCNEDGTGLVTFGTNPIGAIWDGRVAPTTDTIGVNSGSSSARAFLFSFDFTAATPDTLAAYDTASGSLVANLGSWPSGSFASGGSEYLANNGATIYFLLAPAPPNYANPYLVNVNVSNSAQQLANTPTVNETRVGAGTY